MFPQALSARSSGDNGMGWLGTMERLGTMDRSQPRRWGCQAITAWPGSALEVLVGEPPPAPSPSREAILLLSAALAGTAPLQRMPGSEMCPGLTAAAWPATHTALAHSAPGLTAGLWGPPETPGDWGDLDLPRPTQPCPESKELPRDRRLTGWAVGAAQLGGGSPRMGGGCIPEGW